MSIIRIGDITPYFSTEFGNAYHYDSIELLKEINSESIDLIVTSPPFALLRQKRYGNKNSREYIKWFIDNFAYEFKRILKPSGSLVIDIGGSWIKGSPTRSLYHFELMLNLCDDEAGPGFHLAQEFYWYNPAKLPSPIQWVNIERIRVKDAINPVWWFSKEERPKANNRNILTPYKSKMKKLLKDGYNDGLRPSQHVVSKVWGKDNGGAIPPNLIGYESSFEEFYTDNLLEIPNTRSRDDYLDACKNLGIKTHPARFPYELPEFFIKFLTDPGDLVFDPFGGSCVTGKVAEDLKRNWITSELMEDYVIGSKYRFQDFSEKDNNENVNFNIHPEVVTD